MEKSIGVIARLEAGGWVGFLEEFLTLAGGWWAGCERWYWEGWDGWWVRDGGCDDGVRVGVGGSFRDRIVLGRLFWFEVRGFGYVGVVDLEQGAC